MSRWFYLLNLTVICGFFCNIGTGCRSIESNSDNALRESIGGIETQSFNSDYIKDPFAQKISSRDLLSAEQARVKALTSYSRGISLELQGESKASLNEFLKSANADPANEKLVLSLVQELINVGRTNDAALLMKRSCSRKEVNANLLAWWALAETANGNYSEGIKIAEKSIKQDKKTVLAYKVLLGIYLGEDQSEKSLEVLKNAEIAVEDSIPGLLEVTGFYLGYSRMISTLGIDPKEEANRLLNRVEILIKEDENARPEWYEIMANLLVGLEQYSEALPIYDQLLEKYPGHIGLREKRVNTLMRMGEDAAAELELRGLLRANPSNFNYALLLGDLCQKTGRYREAGDFYYYANSVKKDPRLYFMVAQMRFADKQPQKALDMLELTRIGGLNNPELTYLESMCYVEMARFDEALQIALRVKEEVLKNQEYSDLLNEAFYLSLASIYESLGRADEAIALMEEELEKNPKSAMALNALGYTYADHGINLEKAYEMITEALRMAPEEPAIIDSFSWVLYKMGNSEAALPLILKAIENEKSADSTYYDHLGDIYLSLGREIEAVEAWKNALKQNVIVSLYRKVGNRTVKEIIQEKIDRHNRTN